MYTKFRVNRPTGSGEEDFCLIGQAVSEKIFEIVDDDGDGRTPEHGHPISSPCEPAAQVS